LSIAVRQVLPVIFNPECTNESYPGHDWIVPKITAPQP
jgi:hypothetical protein